MKQSGMLGNFVGKRSFRRALSLMLIVIALLALAPVAAAQDGTSPAVQDGEGVRIESEIKLKVPLAQVDTVWDWLQERYADASWLDQKGHTFYATFGNENFVDTYFDTPTLEMLGERSGIRHRVRDVISGSAIAKDDRQLMQIKLNRSDDPSGVARSEIKFDVAPLSQVRNNDDVHPMIGLVDRTQRQQMKDTLQQLDIDPYRLSPVLTLEQNRRRVYVNDQLGPFATLTLDLCKTSSWGVDERWGEMELELNEIRFTEADEATRQAMEQIVVAIQSDVQRAFPEIEQDQTPKYNTTFERIESSTWMPVRTLFRLGLTMSDFTALVVIIVAGALVGMGYGALWLWRRRTETEPDMPAMEPGSTRSRFIQA